MRLLFFFVNEKNKVMVKKWEWKNVDLIDKGEIENSLGWDQNLKSFVIVKRDSSQNLALDLITP